jgi:hypothetical protein
MTKKALAAAGFAALVLAACGGSNQEAQPAAAPAAPYPQQQPGYAQPPPPQGYPSSTQMEKSGAEPAPMTTAPMAPPASAPAPPAAAADSSRDESADRRREGIRELEKAERDIASSDCNTACRALGSMERAVMFLCVSVQNDEDTNRCASVKARLVGARKKVRSSCGSCPGGASVEPDAPIPSKR